VVIPKKSVTKTITTPATLKSKTKPKPKASMAPPKKGTAKSSKAAKTPKEEV